MRHRSGLHVSIEQVESECHDSHNHRKTGGGIPSSPTPEKTNWVEAGAIEVVKEEGGDEKESLGIGGVIAGWKEEEGQP
ncbi:hypothetical protein IC582_009588 [Cucumis melo]